MKTSVRRNIKKTREDSQAYEQQTLQFLALHPAFPKRIGELRKKYDIKVSHEKGLAEYYSWVEAIFEEWPSETQVSWEKDKQKLLQYFELTTNYHEAISFFVVTDSFEGANTSNVRVSVQSKGERMVTIQILAPASKEEVLGAVLLANEMMRTELRRRNRVAKIFINPKKWKGAKYRPRLDRDLKAYELWSQKNKKDKLARIWSNRHIAEELLDEEGRDLKKLGAQTQKQAKQIYEIIRRLKRELHRRFPAHTF